MRLSHGFAEERLNIFGNFPNRDTSIILIIGAPKMVPLFLGDPHLQSFCRAYKRLSGLRVLLISGIALLPKVYVVMLRLGAMGVFGGLGLRAFLI